MHSILHCYPKMLFIKKTIHVEQPQLLKILISGKIYIFKDLFVIELVALKLPLCDSTSLIIYNFITIIIK